MATFAYQYASETEELLLMINQKYRPTIPAMKKILLLALFVFSAQLSPAQSKSTQKNGKAPVEA